MRLGTWNIGSMFSVGSIMTVSRELSRYRLDLMSVQVIWDGSGTEPAEYTFYTERKTRNWVWGFLYIRKSY
jgi:hypothetical protein